MRCLVQNRPVPVLGGNTPMRYQYRKGKNRYSSLSNSQTTNAAPFRSTGLRNVRLLVRPTSWSPQHQCLWQWVSGGGRRARKETGRFPPRAWNLRCTPQQTVPSHVDDASRASRAHIWDVGGVAVLSCRARYKSHITRHINNIALWRHNLHINAR